MERIEAAIEDHYATVTFSEGFRAEVRARLDDALAAEGSNAHELCQQLQGRLTMLDNKESHYLDLVGEPAWPKDKLNAKMIELHDERERLKAELAALDADLKVAHEIFTLALELLRSPQELYQRLKAPERRLLSQLIFTKLFIDEDDGLALTGAEWPSRSMCSSKLGVSSWEQHRSLMERATRTSRTASFPKEDAAAVPASSGGVAFTLLGSSMEHGSSNAVAVRQIGFEPVAVRCGRSAKRRLNAPPWGTG